MEFAQRAEGDSAETVLFMSDLNSFGWALWAVPRRNSPSVI